MPLATAGTPLRTRSYRGYLSTAGHQYLEDFLAQLTWLWNLALSKRKRSWEGEKRSVSLYEQYGEQAVTRQDPALSQFLVGAQRSTLVRMDRAFERFFERVRARERRAKAGKKAGEKPGHPRFKGGHRRIRSFELDQFPMIRTNEKWSWVTIKGIGRIRFRGSPAEGDVKQLRIVRTTRRVKIQLVVERHVAVTPDPRPMVGADMGVKNRVALSTCLTFLGVKLDRSELKRRRRKASKAKRGRRNRAKKWAAYSRECQCGCWGAPRLRAPVAWW